MSVGRNSGYKPQPGDFSVSSMVSFPGDSHSGSVPAHYYWDSQC